MKEVVIIDDSPHILRVLVNFFAKELQFSVLATGDDGNAAVDLYRKHKPALLTLDITMPNMNGITATEKIMHEFPDARILIITAARGKEHRACLALGARSVVFKPLRMSDPVFVTEFRHTVEAVMAAC
jgi:DNA-binding NarL/FixJ family response regulator